MPNVFIAYDFLISGTLVDSLHAVTKRPPTDYTVSWPGAPNNRTQGDIWRHIVKHGIEECERLLAFVDLPNANVGFEIGYGLGLGKRVALAVTHEPRPHWLRRPPVQGLMIANLETPKEIRQEILASDKWNYLDRRPKAGEGVLVLCPERGGAALLEELPEDWSWQHLPASGWSLYDLPDKLENVGLVVWVVSHHNNGSTDRDGEENAAFSVVAGYAAALVGVQVKVLWHTKARDVADIVNVRRPFQNPDSFLNELTRIKEEWDAEPKKPKRKQRAKSAFVRSRQSPAPAVQLAPATTAASPAKATAESTRAQKLEAAANAGDAKAMNSLGNLYHKGEDVEQDYELALAWYRRAADQGNVPAQQNLGMMYDSGLGVAQDDAQALAWYRKAAEQGNAVAQANLGRMYTNGQGVSMDEAQAVAWYQKAAEQGEVDAQVNLGVMHERGQGVAMDDTQAVAWYQKAADQGNATGQAYLADMYETGKGGLAADSKEAIRLYRLAAKQGEDYARKALQRLNVPEQE